MDPTQERRLHQEALLPPRVEGDPGAGFQRGKPHSRLREEYEETCQGDLQFNSGIYIKTLSGRKSSQNG